MNAGLYTLLYYFVSLELLERKPQHVSKQLHMQ